MQILKNMSFTFAYITSSIIAYFAALSIIASNSYKFWDKADIINFVTVVIAVTAVFAVLGVKYKGEALVPAVVMLAVKFILIISLIAFEKTVFGVLVIFVDTVFVYSADFVYYIFKDMNIGYNIARVIAHAFTCLYPMIVFFISRLLANTARKKLNKC